MKIINVSTDGFMALVVGLALQFLTGCAKNEPRSSTYPTVSGSIANDPEMQLMAYALTRTERARDTSNHLLTLLSSGGPYTIFAPTDSAMQDTNYKYVLLTKNTIDSMNVDTLSKLLKGVIVKGRISGVDILGTITEQIPSLSNYSPTLEKNYFGIFLNGAKSTASVNCVDGIVNKIKKRPFRSSDSLIKIIMARPDMKYMSAVIQYTSDKNGYYGYFGKYLTNKSRDGYTSAQYFTFFAPNDGAFVTAGYTDFNVFVQNIKKGSINYGLEATLLNQIFFNKYFYSSDFLHGNAFVDIDGRTIKRTGGQILETDIIAANGVMHVVNSFF